MSSDRPRVLIVSPFVPLSVAGGGGGTYHGLIGALARDFEIDVVCFSDARYSESELEGLRDVCSDVKVFYRSKQQCYRAGLRGLLSGLPLRVGYCRDTAFMKLLLAQATRRHYAAAVASHERMAQYVARLPVPIRVWDLIDVACVRQKIIALTSSRVLQRLISAIDFFLIRSFERMLLRAFAETWVCTGIELRELRWVTRLGNPRVSRRGMSAYFRPSTGSEWARSTVMFMGQLAYEPNADGLRWFVRSIWPLIRAGAPSAVLKVVGPNPPRWLRDKALSDDSIRITGAVDSVEPHLQRAAVFVCPLRIGTGVRIKILEAMAAGCPVVSTTVGFRGIAAVPGRDLAVADTPSDFADEVLHLMTDVEAGARMTASALRHVAPDYTPDAVAAGVAQRIRHLLSSSDVVSEASDTT